ncbi:MAG: hypothetical protein CMJ83_20755 [Planctomycetes bacterium]|nr:hypothetical protein [Planctomycetota bacterium]
MTRLITILAAVAILLSMPACQPASTGANSLDGVQFQDERDVAAAQDKIQPTKRFVAMADHELLWKAARGYVERVFDVDALEAGFIETKTVEWTQNRFPRRTRVTVEMTKEDGNDNNAWLYVTALKIEPVLALESARTGKPIRHAWALKGSRPKVEEVVAGQIMRRYLLLRDGKDPDAVPLEGPIPGISPTGEMYKSGVAGKRK